MLQIVRNIRYNADVTTEKNNEKLYNIQLRMCVSVLMIGLESSCVPVKKHLPCTISSK